MKTKRLRREYEHDLRRLNKAIERVARWAEFLPRAAELQRMPSPEIQVIRPQAMLLASPQATRHVNARIGWALLVMAFVLAALIDPIYFLPDMTFDPEKLISRIYFNSNYTQGVLVFLGLFQITLSRIVKGSPRDRRKLRLAVWVTVVGGVIYVASGILSMLHLTTGWVTPGGSALMFAGTLMFLSVETHAHRYILQIVLIFTATGIALDALVQVLMLHPEDFSARFAMASDDDSYAQRLLRLGRAAMLVMPLLALLYSELRPLVSSEGREAKVYRFGQQAILFGAGGLGILLAATALIAGWIMNLALVAGTGMWIGTVLAAYFAWKRQARPLEIFGWVLAGLSMTIGVGMALYAFKFLVTIPAPPGLAEYYDIDRRFIRTGHTYMTVLGTVCVYAGSELRRVRARGWWRSAALAAAVLFLEVMLLLIWKLKLSTVLLALGPLAVALALTPFLRRGGQRPAELPLLPA